MIFALNNPTKVSKSSVWYFFRTSPSHAFSEENLKVCLYSVSRKPSSRKDALQYWIICRRDKQKIKIRKKLNCVSVIIIIFCIRDKSPLNVPLRIKIKDIYAKSRRWVIKREICRFWKAIKLLIKTKTEKINFFCIVCVGEISE